MKKDSRRIYKKKREKCVYVCVCVCVCVREEEKKEEKLERAVGAKVYGVHIRTSDHDVKEAQAHFVRFRRGMLNTIRNYADADSGKKKLVTGR